METSMETLYDFGGDLKELWESDYDPAMQEALKLSTDTDMHEWFLERDPKIQQVILHDKSLTDALGTLPIKTEHSYSLNSDGDSMPDSPHSLQNKMDDMDEECYPVMQMNSATRQIGIVNSNIVHINLNNNNNNHTINNNTINQNVCYTTSSRDDNAMIITTNPIISTNQILSTTPAKSTPTTLTTIMNQNVGSPDTSSSTTGSDIDVDDTMVKDEPLSPQSSCPPSPQNNGVGGGGGGGGGGGNRLLVNLANVAAYTNADIVFDHKNGSLQLSTASQSLLKNQQLILTAQQQQQRITMSKLNIKMEPQMSTFGLPPTPPSSLPSDDSEGNQSPEHHTSSSNSSPTSPATISSSVVTSSSKRSNTSLNGSSTRIYSTGSSSRQPIHTPLISSQPKGSTGTLSLTEEEKRTLTAEGYPIPTRLPLTKAEEKSLKKIRRKIKNKISAQESRRKKKEYMDQLERKVEILATENTDYRKRIEQLEGLNCNLLDEVAKLKALVNNSRQGVLKKL